MIKWDNDVKLFCKPWSSSGRDYCYCYKRANIPRRKVKDKFWESQEWEVGRQPCGAWLPNWAQQGSKWQGGWSPWLGKEATGNMKTTCSQSPLFAPLFYHILQVSEAVWVWTINTQNLVASRAVVEFPGARPVSFLSLSEMRTPVSKGCTDECKLKVPCTLYGAQ